MILDNLINKEHPTIFTISKVKYINDAMYYKYLNGVDKIFNEEAYLDFTYLNLHYCYCLSMMMLESVFEKTINLSLIKTYDDLYENLKNINLLISSLTYSLLFKPDFDISKVKAIEKCLNAFEEKFILLNIVGDD